MQVGKSFQNSLIKKSNSKKNIQTKTEKQQEVQICKHYPNHPASKFLGTTKPSQQQFKKFITLLYRGLFYSVNNLKGPSEQFIKKKSVALQQPKNACKKFLILDLDETLIHSIFNNQKSDIAIKANGEQFKFNIRPYCLEFLERMSQHFSIYVFTASTIDYAQPIVNHLNEKFKTIHGVLHRKNCMQTHNGFYIKDLRIIKNRQLKDMVIVDNLVHSFGLQIDNGIPILDFTNNKNDEQLLCLEKMLLELKEYEDVRQYISKKVNLKKCLQHHETDFLQPQHTVSNS